ncbi:hypothetical protein BSYN_16210 [Bacteroides sedimenti]|uniref:Uncharacterized protein n=1 Tax=Bacteroides sedimenti TaxID=2136147 RepID=A0ABM8IBH9_9BACE
MKFRDCCAESKQNHVDTNAGEPTKGVFFEHEAECQNEKRNDAQYNHENLAITRFVKKRMGNVYPYYQGNQESDKGILVQMYWQLHSRL